MQETRIWGPGIAVVSLVLASGCLFGPESHTEDRSDFMNFVFSQSGAEGFCPDLQLPARLELDRLSPGLCMLKFSVFVEGDPDTCAMTVDRYCVQDAGERTLSSDEFDSVLAAFREVIVIVESEGVERCGNADPCRVYGFRWDGEYRGDNVCSRNHLNRSTAERIVELARELVGASLGSA